jgi:hypothetical protein
MSLDLGRAMAFATTPFLASLKLRTGYSPFLHLTAPSALLAGLLVKWSSVIAPSWGIQVSAWTFTFLYLYFALARAAFVRSHCLLHGKGIEAATVARGELAFAVSMRRRRQGFSLFAGGCVLAAALLDILLRAWGAARPNAVMAVILAPAFMGWLLFCPSFLVASSLWVTEPNVSVSRGHALTQRFQSLVRLPWLGVVGLIALVSLVPLHTLYEPLRAIVLNILPSARAAYFYSAVFLAFLIAFQFWIQAIFAAWITPKLTTREQEQEIADRVRRRDRRGQRPAQLWLTAAMGLVLCVLSVLFQFSLPPSAMEVVTARVVSSVPTCTMTRRAGKRGIRTELPCLEAEAERGVADSEGQVRIEPGAALDLRFTTRSGTEHNVRQFFPSTVATPAAAAGEIRVLYDPERPSVLRHHPGQRYVPWWSYIPPALGVAGLMCLFGALIHRLGRPRSS